MKYTGGCHCGQVRFEVEMEIGKVISCNCSMCQKRGSLLSFSSWENFRLLKGESNLTEYLFNKHVIKHRFCKTCGILSFAQGLNPKDGKEMAAINVRCLDNIEIDQLDIMKVDGRSF